VLKHIAILTYSLNLLTFEVYVYVMWLRSLRPGSAATSLLRLLVWILLGAWISLSRECCVLWS